MENLTQLGFPEMLADHVHAGKPLLGICLGMQLLFSKSYEMGEFQGLNFLHGEIKRFPSTVKIPHMGWNQIEILNRLPFVHDVEEKSFVYFVHSYFVSESDEITVAATDYGIRFSSIVQQNNIYGIQFHPEKSQRTGAQLMKNFADL